MKNKLTDEEIKFYEENGYLVIPEFLDGDHCHQISQAVDDCVKGDYRNYLTLHEDIDIVKQLITNRDLLALADQLQSHRMIPIGSIYFFCKPNNPLENGSYPHQDNYAPKSPVGSYLVGSVSFDDADKENGALIVYPKTHLLGDLPCEDSKNFEYASDQTLSKVYPIGSKVVIPEGYEEKQLEYKKGSLIFLHGHTIHFAHKNSSDRWRRTIYLHYIKDGHPFWPGWNAKRQLIERGDFIGAS